MSEFAAGAQSYGSTQGWGQQSLSDVLAAKASDNLLKLFSQGVVPQSSLALESSMSAYQVGNVDFLTVIGNFTTVLNYETNSGRR